MRELIIIIGIFSMSIGFGYGQTNVYKEISFKNLNPLWIHAPIDSSLISQNNSGRENFNNTSDIPKPYLINDGYLYIAHHTYSWTGEVEGALLEKINLVDGQVEWNVTWDLRNNERQEWVESLFLDKDGYLDVITDRRLSAPYKDFFNTFTFFGDTCLISIRKFNITTGNLIEHIVSKNDDFDAIRIKNSVFGKTILYPVSNNEFQYYEYNDWQGTISLYKINGYGHLISDVIIDTVQFFENIDVSKEDIKFTRYMVKVNRDTLVTLDVLIGEPNSNIDTQNIVTVYDNEMNVINKFRIDSLLDFNYKKISLKYATENFIEIYGQKRVQTNHNENFYIILNYKGEIQRKYSGVYKNKNHSLGFPLFLNKENEYMESCFSAHYYGLDFVLTNPYDSVNLLKEFYFKDKNYGYYTNHLITLKNGDILTIGSTNYYDGSRYIAICPTIMRIKAEDLGIESAFTNDILIETEKLILTPNPVVNNLKVSSENLIIRKILVFNIFGELLIKKEVTPHNIQYLNVENLGRGIYIIKAYNDKDKYEIGKFIKQ